MRRRKRAYVSERITNISELERRLEQASISLETVKKELNSDCTNIEQARLALNQACSEIDSVRTFEFVVERRVERYTFG